MPEEMHPYARGRPPWLRPSGLTGVAGQIENEAVGPPFLLEHSGDLDGAIRIRRVMISATRARAAALGRFLGHPIMGGCHRRGMGW